MKRYAVELVGTFFLVLTIGTAAGLGHAGAATPLAVGAVLVALIFAGGHVSGAHYNPAVTLAFWLRGTFPRRDIPGFLLAQLVGAGLAAGAVSYLGRGAPLTAARFELGPALLAEVLFTFALCWVILNVASAHALAGNPVYGLAIGALVTAGIYAVGPTSGAVFNPAVAFGLCAVGLAAWSSFGVYLAAHVLGAVAAVAFFKATVD